MKKALSLILALVLCLSLCACGKSEEAQSVDDLILAIGDVTIDSKDAIAVADDAYNALSEKDKEAVEHYAELTEAKNTLKEVMFESLTERLEALNYQCDTVSTFVYLLWDNVGPSDFTTYFKCILMFEDENSLDEMKAYYAQKSSGQKGWIINVWCAGNALDSSRYGDVDLGDDELIEEIVGKCIAFTSVFNSLSTTDEELSEDISDFVKAYKNDYPEEAEILREWNLESSMYVEFALEPSGSLVSYGNEMGEYQDTMSRFQKEADSLK